MFWKSQSGDNGKTGWRGRELVGRDTRQEDNVVVKET